MPLTNRCFSQGRGARLKPFLCFKFKDVPLLVGFGASSEVGELALQSHCFSEDSDAVPRRRSPEGDHQDFGRSLIRNENEYKDAVRRWGEQAERLKQQAVQLKQTKLFKDAIKRVLDPVRSFHEQIKDEVASYERLKRASSMSCRTSPGSDVYSSPSGSPRG